MTRYRGAGGPPQRGRRPGGRRRRPVLVDPTLDQNNRSGIATISREVSLPEQGMTLSALAELLGTTSQDLQKRLLLKGRMSNPNSAVDYETSRALAAELGATVVDADEDADEAAESAATRTAMERHVLDEDEENLVARPPVVTIMGHVDHGKTSLLDAIRNARVAEGEAGGITQHIGAYQVEHQGRTITFIDTPGHAAFTEMRARGAQVTDVAIVVVAADDGIMPQSLESISHAKAAGVPFIIAINKIDRPNANPDRVKQQLSENGVFVQGWGGDVETVQVSALQGLGLDELLELIILVTDLEEPKANPDRPAVGAVIEARLDRSRGPVATVLVQNGTLRAGDFVVVDKIAGRVRSMQSFMGERLKEAGPSTPVEVTGLEAVPAAGDRLTAVPNERAMRALIEERTDFATDSQGRMTLDDLLTQISSGETKELNIILKADVQGSVEAIRGALAKVNDAVAGTQARVIFDAVGAPTQDDVNLALASKAIIVAFNVKPDSGVKTYAEKNGVEIREYQIIYNLLDDVETALRGLVEPTFREVVYGHAEVRLVVRSGRGQAIVGCYVRDGQVQRGAGARVTREGQIVYNGRVATLKRFKDDVREVNAGYECGMGLDNWPDPKEGDVIEVFGRERV